MLPDRVEARDLGVSDADELAAARARLMAALAQTGRKKAPLSAAEAQTSFDCWLEMTEDEDPPEQIETCKGAFEAAMAEVEQALTRDIVPASGEDAYLVFFAWDQATLTPVALTVLDQVEADYLVGRPARIVIAGHADRSGSEAYNQALSERRAQSVAQALGQRGIPTSAMRVEGLRREPIRACRPPMASASRRTGGSRSSSASSVLARRANPPSRSCGA